MKFGLVAKTEVEACEAYQTGVFPEGQTALIETVAEPPTAQAKPPATEVGEPGIALTVTIYATDGRQFGLLPSGVGFNKAYT